MTIALNQIASVLPQVLGAAGSTNNLNGLVVSQSTELPNGQLVSFATSTAVGNYFGLQSPEYEAAVIYFAGTKKATRLPGTLFFGRYNLAAAAAFLRGGSMQGVSLSQLQALSGTLIVTSGGTVQTSASISLSAATSFQNAATLMQAGFTSPPFTISYDTQQQTFVVTNTATGATSTITTATGTLAAGVKLDVGDGAIVSPGAAVDTPAAAMTRLRSYGQQWAGWTTAWQPVTADMVSFGTWNGQQGDQIAYCPYDNDPNALVLGSTTTLVAQLEAASVDGTIATFGNLTHAAFVLAWIASLNFGATNGRSTLAFQSQSGLLPSVTDTTSYQNLTANGYNCYGAFAGGQPATFQWFQEGEVTGQFEWADTYVNQIWFSSALQLAMATLLDTANSIPYNAIGYNEIEAALVDPITQMINFGGIRAGVTLAASQIQELTTQIGVDISQTLAQRGWYLQVVDATSSQRVQRQSPGLYLWYCDGGSVQKLNLISTVIQ